MLYAAWLAVLAVAAMLAGGPSLGTVRAGGHALAADTTGIAGPTSPPTPTPLPTPNRPPPPGGGIGGGGNITPTCPDGWALEADGNCHLFIYVGGHYAI